jgi:hypothetical protein
MVKLECVGRIIEIYTVCPEGILSSVFFTVTSFKNKAVETERGENRAHMQETESNNARTKGMR